MVRTQSGLGSGCRVGAAFGAAAVVGLVGLASCSVPPGVVGNDGAGGAGGGGPAVSDVGGFFAADESWMLVSPQQMLFLGFGDRTEFATVTDGVSAAACVGIEPSAALTIGGGAISLTSQFADANANQTCSISISGGLADCMPIGFGLPPNLCDVSVVAGQYATPVASLQPDVLQLVRFDRCDSIPTSLDDVEAWAMFNIHPFAAAFLNRAGPLGAIVAVGGMGSSVVQAASTTDTTDGCIDNSPSGTASLVGDRLTLEVQMIDEAGRGNCSVSFDGTRTYCALFDPARFQATGDATQLLRFDGSGEWSIGSDRGRVEVLYLAIPLSPVPVNPPLRQ